MYLFSLQFAIKTGRTLVELWLEAYGTFIGTTPTITCCLPENEVYVEVHFYSITSLPTPTICDNEVYYISLHK